MHGPLNVKFHVQLFFLFSKIVPFMRQGGKML